MSNPTSNYSFQMPTSSDLVTDLPADFEVFGQAVDTQMKTNADAATQKATLTTKGDIYAATAASTPARLAVGSNGQILTADSTAATGLAWTTSTSGGMTSIASGTLSGSSVVLSSINQTYKDLRLILRGVTMNTSDTYITLKANAISTGYNAAWALSYQDAGYVGGNSNETVWRIAADAAQLRTNDQNMYVYDFFDYTSTNDTKLASGYWHIYSGDLRVYTAALSVIGVDAAISSLTISNNAGNTFSGGTYELFGVK